MYMYIYIYIHIYLHYLLCIHIYKYSLAYTYSCIHLSIYIQMIGELRVNSGIRLFDVEQFIDNFDPDIVDISIHTPDYLQIHIRLKV
jgi:hypothetical protein